jgi:hypothetical protein
MNQSRIESFVEQCVNMFFKFWVAVAVWHFGIRPALAAGWLSVDHSIVITIIFTILSLIQGYFWRRVFNGINLHQKVHTWVTEFYAARTKNPSPSADRE